VFLAMGGTPELQTRLLKTVRENGGSVIFKANRESKHVARMSDYLLSVQYDKIFTRKQMARYLKCFNVHFSMLPLHRGCLPINWALWEGTPIGVTIHEMTTRIDDGAIIAQSQIDVAPDETAYTAYLKCWELCFEMLREHLPKLLTRKYTCAPQDHQKATYHRRGEFPNDRYIEEHWDDATKDRMTRALYFPGKEGARLREVGFYNDSV